MKTVNWRTIRDEVESQLDIAEMGWVRLHWHDLERINPEFNRLTLKKIWHTRESRMKNAEEAGKYLSRREQEDFDYVVMATIAVLMLLGIVLYILNR